MNNDAVRDFLDQHYDECIVGEDGHVVLLSERTKRQQLRDAGVQFESFQADEQEHYVCDSWVGQRCIRFKCDECLVNEYIGTDEYLDQEHHSEGNVALVEPPLIEGAHDEYITGTPAEDGVSSLDLQQEIHPEWPKDDANVAGMHQPVAKEDVEPPVIETQQQFTGDSDHEKDDRIL